MTLPGNNHLVENIKLFTTRVDKDAWIFVPAFLVLTLIIWAYFRSTWLLVVGIVMTVWCWYFFRDPDRVTPCHRGIAVSPADGIVQRIARVPTLDGSGECQRISIFLSIFDVHVNRIPISGLVSQMHYIPGTFINASLDKASEQNERQISIIETQDGARFGIVQIAGLVARRIRCDLKPGQEVTIGDRFGIIRFGSRVDLYVPDKFQVEVLEGQRMVGGETIVARARTR